MLNVSLAGVYSTTGGANSSGVCHLSIVVYYWSSLSTCCCLLLLIVLLKVIIELLLLPVGIILAAIGVKLIIKLLLICLQQGRAHDVPTVGNTHDSARLHIKQYTAE